MSEKVDLVIRNGTIVDGSGEPSFVGDVAVKGGWITAVGRVDVRGLHEIDATGLLVTPGFVDPHTHYDGQLIWSDRLSPSSEHGVTTVMTGNCGIGFAPCRPADRDMLISMMEGVEDIPEAVATAGLSWDWETFPQYLDAIDRRSRDIDVVALLPHSPLRVYAMGQRGANREPATDEDLARMKALTREAIDAGAIGFGTSRVLIHRTSKGEQIPSFEADERELSAIGEALHEADSGVFQLVSNLGFGSLEDELGLIRRIARSSGRPVTYTQAQPRAPDRVEDILTALSEANAEPGVTVKAQVFPRPIGLIVGLRTSVHPFSMAPSYERLRALPLAEKVAEMRKPEVRAALISEPPDNPANPVFLMSRNFASIFPMDPGRMTYEPDRSESVAERARAIGKSSEEYAYDLLLQDDGNALLMVAIGNYANYNLDFIGAMLKDPNVIVGLGDGGAHYGMICDASYPTHALAYWARDRDHGRLSLEETVQHLSRKPAELLGLRDRGLIAPGHRASINIIDHAALRLHAPEVVRDLPGGGLRLHQRADGYVVTLVDGVAIMENGQPTSARPGRLVRGTQLARA